MKRLATGLILLAAIFFSHPLAVHAQRAFALTLMPDIMQPAEASDVVTLLHFDGTASSAVMADATGRTWTAQGDASLDTTVKKFGASSLMLDGSDSIYTASSADFSFEGNENFTFDFWVNFRSLIDGYIAIFDTGNYGAGKGVYLQIRESNTSLCVILNGTFIIYQPNTFAVGTWYHIAVVRDDDTVKLFRDGTQIGTGTYAGAIPSDLTFYIGREASGLYVNANIDEFRVMKGIAAWTSDFTPPSEPYSAGQAMAPSKHVTIRPGGKIRLTGRNP